MNIGCYQRIQNGELTQLTIKKADMNIEKIFDEIVEVLYRAGESIIEIYNSGESDIEKKKDNTPVTKADKASSLIIQESLLKLTPNIKIIDEEGHLYPYKERKGWDKYWLIDPLDGTKEFINRSDEFAINICLIENNKPSFGLIYSPVKQLLYYSIKGEGVTKWKIGEKPEKIEAKEVNGKKIKIYTSRSQLKIEETNLINKLSEHGFHVEKVTCSSSIKNGYIAEGKGDLYFKYGKTSEWDTAPGQLILEELGGAILSLEDLKPLRYNKENLLNPPFVILRKGEDFQKEVISILINHLGR